MKKRTSYFVNEFVLFVVALFICQPWSFAESSPSPAVSPKETVAPAPSQPAVIPVVPSTEGAPPISDKKIESTTVPATVSTPPPAVETKKEKAVSKNVNLLVYFTHKDQDEVEELRPLIRPLSNSCAKCDISIVSINYKGSAIDLKDLQKKVSDIPENAKMVVFDFNLKDSADTQFWAEQLRKLQSRGVLIVSSTGRALESEIPIFLNKTVLGQNQNVILIGELSEKERMWPLSHFGPEILTALKLPDQYSGQDLAGLYVAMRILPKVQQKTMEEWVKQLSEKKFKTKKIWLDLDEI